MSTTTTLIWARCPACGTPTVLRGDVMQHATPQGVDCPLAIVDGPSHGECPCGATADYCSSTHGPTCVDCWTEPDWMADRDPVTRVS